MAVLSADLISKYSPRGGTMSFVAADTIIFFAGGLVGTNAAGYLAKWADTAGHRFLGLIQASCTGAILALPPVEGRVDTSGVTLKAQVIASLATQAEVNTLVYCSTDNVADFTTVASTNVEAVGWCSRFISAGVGDVTLFTPGEYIALNA